MPELRPFRALRYDFDRLDHDLSSVIAPPYDVLDENDKARLLSLSESNIVKIDLPHLPPKSAGPAEVYSQAADALESLIANGTILREAEPAIYVFHQQFEYEGKPCTRRMFIACLRLAEFSEGTILPHERTFGGPKEDRLALMKASGTQLSPIFGLYRDENNAVGSLFDAIVARPPDATGKLGEVKNSVWVVTNPATIDAVSQHMADRNVYIADGHHRYGTALAYRKWAAEEANGVLPDSHPANSIMFVLASMDDPGCLILPYHRAVENVTLAALEKTWAPGTETVALDDANIVLVEGATGRELGLRYSDRKQLRSLRGDECEAWYDLDYAYLHCYLIDHLLKSAIGVDPTVRYLKSAERARQVARDNVGVALLTQATPMAHLKAVSEEGGLMPQKSTYFHPKVATGLAMYALR